MKVAQANKAVAAARKALARQAAAGTDPRRDPEVNRKRAVAISEAHRRNREWKREHGTQPRDEAWFRREVLPKLDGFSLKELAAATGLSLVACSAHPLRFTPSPPAALGYVARASRRAVTSTVCLGKRIAPSTLRRRHLSQEHGASGYTHYAKRAHNSGTISDGKINNS